MSAGLENLHFVIQLLESPCSSVRPFVRHKKILHQRYMLHGQGSWIFALWICIIRASSMHHPCIIRASSVHHPSINRASSIHHPCIIRASFVHLLCIIHASSVHHPCIIDTCIMYTIIQLLESPCSSVRPFVRYQKVPHHPCIIRASFVHHPCIIRASSVHHPCIVRS